MSLLDPRALGDVDAHRDAFRSAHPFRHVVIPSFFRGEFSERLLADFPRFEARHALNEMGEIGGKAVRMDVCDIAESYRELDRFLRSEEFLGYVSRVTGIPDLLYDPDYVGGGTHENRHGQSLDAHVDFNYHPRTNWHRRLNLIVYLNREWGEDWGGALELHANPWSAAENRTVSVAPLFNRCVIFETTESSWHGFSEIALPPSKHGHSRKSFAIYLYTRERPREETAPPHATVYVPDAMPAGWAPGRVLDESDVRNLTQRFTRLRAQLRYLYEREKRFGDEIAALKQALGESRRAHKLDLEGYATQPDGVEGVWPDGWAGREVTLRFVPSVPVKGLLLDLWCPAELEADQSLEIRVGHVAAVEQLRRGRRTKVKLAVRAGAGEAIAWTMRAARTWTPAASGASGDERPLAYKIVSASLQH